MHTQSQPVFIKFSIKYVQILQFCKIFTTFGVQAGKLTFSDVYVILSAFSVKTGGWMFNLVGKVQFSFKSQFFPNISDLLHLHWKKLFQFALRFALKYWPPGWWAGCLLLAAQSGLLGLGSFVELSISNFQVNEIRAKTLQGKQNESRHEQFVRVSPWLS